MVAVKLEIKCQAGVYFALNFGYFIQLDTAG